MFEQIKASKANVRMQVKEVFKVIEYKKGCVYKTKSLGYIVCEPLYQFLDMKDIQLHSPGTKVLRQLI